MASEPGEAAPAAAAPESNQSDAKKPQAEQKNQSQGSSKDQAAPAQPEGEKKLTNAELKKRQKEAKAAKRAQAKAAQTSQAPAQGGPLGSSGGAADGKGAKGKPKQDGHPAQGGGHSRQPSRPANATTVAKEPKPAVPDCFSHLSMARRMEMTHADKDVHSAVLVLGQYMSTFAISDSITRLEATLLAFKKVIDSYITPHGATLSRHFTSHVLNPQIEYLTACRPMCFSMGNAIRWLKLQISKIDPDLPDQEAKDLLCQSIDNFIRERITLADFIIVKTAAEMISNDAVVLTYAHHNLVERVLLRAREDGKRFRVILVDDPFERVGIQHAKTLASKGIGVTYCSDLGALRTNLKESTIAMLAAEALFSNGAMYARSGTCDIATEASDMEVEVIALCETINFTERVSIDSLTYNEIDPERNSDAGFRLLFDTTRETYLHSVVTELGDAAAMSVPAILRKLEEL